MIHERQAEYYRSINVSNCAGESTTFIEFMLSTIKESLVEAIVVSDGMSDASMDKPRLRWHLIEKHLQTNDSIQNGDVRKLCGVSAATANRILNQLVQDGKLHSSQQKGQWIYRAQQ